MQLNGIHIRNYVPINVLKNKSHLFFYHQQIIRDTIQYDLYFFKIDKSKHY